MNTTGNAVLQASGMHAAQATVNTLSERDSYSIVVKKEKKSDGYLLGGTKFDSLNSPAVLWTCYSLVECVIFVLQPAEVSRLPPSLLLPHPSASKVRVVDLVAMVNNVKHAFLVSK